LSAQYRRLARRINKKKAAIAVAHSLIVIVYYVLVRDRSYQDLGGDYFDRQHAPAAARLLVAATGSARLPSNCGAELIAAGSQ
jgi:hypothetical protein